MADCSDPGIKATYEDVRDDKTDTTYGVFKYEGKQKIVLATTGTGGLAELGENFAEDEAAFAFLRITTGDEESKRAKFVLVSWCGEKVGALARAKMSVHKASVKEICRDFAVEKHYTEKSELNDEELSAEVQKAGGANYSGYQ
eukprot:TRINITY_DN144_c0_g1_i1.p1 TRINITY_DN144_c0_g1~~TRINITY_DN144_c0_g1_i1.p1  ORF type:complete len:143 (-),score=61.94 TRINITY_DN144_c0_g1_i1:149-577(-)